MIHQKQGKAILVSELLFEAIHCSFIPRVTLTTITQMTFFFSSRVERFVVASPFELAQTTLFWTTPSWNGIKPITWPLVYPEISPDRKIGRALLRTRARLKMKQGGGTNIFCEHLPTSSQAANFCLVAKNRLVYGPSEVALIKKQFQNDKSTFFWFIILSSFEYRVSVFLSRRIRSSCFAGKFGAVPFYFLLMLSNSLLNSFIHHFFGKNAIRGAVRTSLEVKNNQQSKSLSLSSLRQPNRRQEERDVWIAYTRHMKSLT